MILKFLFPILIIWSLQTFGQTDFTVADLKAQGWANKDALKKDLQMPDELENLIHRIIEVDQKLRKENSPTGTKQDLEHLRLLDSIIGAQGWPSSIAMETKGIGIALILAHMGTLTAQNFDHYYRLAAERCIKREERWDVALFILEQRYQWLGSNHRVVNENPDTLVIEETEKGIIDPLFTQPYFAAMSKTMSTNSTKKVEITVPNADLGNRIKKLLFALEYEVDMPPEVLEMLISGGFDHPAPLSDERIIILVDEQMESNKIAYRFFRGR